MAKNSNVIPFPAAAREIHASRKLVVSRLIDARLAARMNQTELAAAVGVTRQAISTYEQGERTPDPATLQAIADELKQPIGYFLTEDRPVFGHFSANFYRKVGRDTKRRNMACDVYARWFAQTAFAFDEVANFPEVDIPAAEPEAPDEVCYEDEQIEDIADGVRKHFGLGLGPISNVLRLLETKGVVICRVQVPNEHIEAFSFWSGSRPFVFLASQKESQARARFDAAHELGHLVLHRWIGRDEIEDKSRLREIEAEADHFAGAFLLPRTSFPNEVYTPRVAAFVELKKRWKVSISAMVYRCKDLGIFDDRQITNLWKQLSYNKWRTKEPLDDPVAYPLEEPLLLRRIVELVIEHNRIHPDEIKNGLALSPSTIEQLANLPDGFLSTESAPVLHPTLK